MADVQGERLRAEAELGRAQPGDKLTKSEVRLLVQSLVDIASVLRSADPKDKAEIYAELGVRITYGPNGTTVIAEASPCTRVRVGGAYDPPSTPVLLRDEVILRAA